MNYILYTYQKKKNSGVHVIGDVADIVQIIQFKVLAMLAY